LPSGRSRPPRTLRLHAGFAVIVTAGVLLLAAAADAELTQQGKLIVSFGAGLTPKVLPRERPAPVAVHVAGGFKASKGAELPQLRTISVAINRAGQLYDRGLPTCRVKAIQPATEAGALALCRRAIVGSGQVTIETHLDNQAPFAVTGNLLAFNGPREHGQKLILAQVYAEDPPGAFVLTFTVRHGPGLFGTVLSTTLPKEAHAWAYLTHFEMTLHRTYRFHGRTHSYVSAACTAPAGFPGAVFPFAKATYGFANGQRTSTTVIRSCRVGDN
jgi:hypothetical protein